ncbi:bark storage protein A-like [Hibiscus syriacus]|uniref:bark storage protein A-like n=1 Tax=Hibiscus syriacus TaxID=106335 RepID=UPI00192476E0|nr:bark storage protein A-like [Hibiscus syriacus]XP_039067301.1 bark storage protein A-like [Hibiscus syriacus]
MGGQVKPCLVLVFTFFLLVLASAVSTNRIKFLKQIREVNRRGPYIGLITVFATEEDAFFASGSFKPDPKYPFIDLSGRRFRIGQVRGREVVYVRCGIGTINAVAATQQMLDVFHMKGIIHFGIAGNTNNSMSIGDVTIPKQVAHTGIWDWVNPNSTVDPADVAQLDIGNYNVAKRNGTNLLGHIGYNKEQFYSVSGEPNVAERLVWAEITPHWLRLASSLEGIKLEQCVNSSLCLPEKPKLVVGLRASTANIFVDNAAYRDFLLQEFGVSSADMESAAVVMTSLSNGFPVIVIRGLSDLAGNQQGDNAWIKFGSLAALNSVKVVLGFISNLPHTTTATS